MGVYLSSREYEPIDSGRTRSRSRYAASCGVKRFMEQMAPTEPQRSSAAHLVTSSKGHPRLYVALSTSRPQFGGTATQRLWKTELKNKQTNDSTDQKIFRRTVNVRVTRDIKMLGKIREENEKCF